MAQAPTASLSAGSAFGVQPHRGIHFKVGDSAGGKQEALSGFSLGRVFSKKKNRKNKEIRRKNQRREEERGEGREGKGREERVRERDFHLEQSIVSSNSTELLRIPCLVGLTTGATPGTSYLSAAPSQHQGVLGALHASIPLPCVPTRRGPPTSHGPFMLPQQLCSKCEKLHVRATQARQAASAP